MLGTLEKRFVPTPDNRGNDLDYRIIAGDSYAFAKLVAALPFPPPSLPASSPPVERGMARLVLQFVHFEFDKSRLTPLGCQVLDEAAQKFPENPHRSVEIEGQTDTLGAEAYNLGLTNRCAEVAEGSAVWRHRIDLQRMSTLSNGEARPIADYRSQEERALNRR
jgi:outer membrane protein OmpA-like peptidoglycan-associated protein